MAQVTVTIAGKTYRMACDDGQEAHLFGLAARLDAMIDEMRDMFGEIGDQRLTVMASITALDRISETERRVVALEADLVAAAAERDRLLARQAEIERLLAERLIEAAGKLDALSATLDG